MSCENCKKIIENFIDLTKIVITNDINLVRNEIISYFDLNRSEVIKYLCFPKFIADLLFVAIDENDNMFIDEDNNVFTI